MDGQNYDSQARTSIVASRDNDGKFTGWIFFQQLFRMAESCVAVAFTHLWGMSILSTNIPKGGVAARLICGGYLITAFLIQKFNAKCAG